MDEVQCLNLFDQAYPDLFGESMIFASTELGWKITINDSVLTVDPDWLFHELVKQIQLRLLVLKAFQCEAVFALEVIEDEEPEWDNELIPEIWKW